MLRATMKIPSNLALECTLKKLPASLTDGTMRKTLSVSAASSKRFVINDHYEFDQKVNHAQTLLDESVYNWLQAFDCNFLSASFEVFCMKSLDYDVAN